ncbi:hypothetical protein [uncultured Microbacterium sp.]|nr:hypothetical protein [uncultured Microbacterium sp.]
MTYTVTFIDADGEGWSADAGADELGRVIAQKVARGCVITGVSIQ